MKLSDITEDQQLDELLPTLGAAGAAAPGAAAAPTQGAQPAGQAMPQANDPKAQALMVLQTKERKDGIVQQMKDIDKQIQDLTKQKSELQKQLATIK